MRPCVIKFGGSVFKDAKAQDRFLKDLADLSRKAPVVLVHGGGPEITRQLEAWGIKTRFVKGLRYTDERTMEAVEMILSGKVNKALTARLNRLGVKAVGLSGVDGKLLTAAPVPKLGLVGEPRDADPELLLVLLSRGYLPVVSPVASDSKGVRLNVNADSMAGALAQALHAERYISVTDVPGVLDAKGRTIPKIRIKDIAGLIRKGVVKGGMVPKLEAAGAAIRQGVGEVDIVDGRKGIARLIGTRIIP